MAQVEIIGLGLGSTDYFIQFDGPIESTDNLEAGDQTLTNQANGGVKDGSDFYEGPLPVTIKNEDAFFANPPQFQVDVDGDTRTVEPGESVTFTDESDGSDGSTDLINLINVNVESLDVSESTITYTYTIENESTSTGAFVDVIESATAIKGSTTEEIGNNTEETFVNTGEKKTVEVTYNHSQSGGTEIQACAVKSSAFGTAL